MRPRLLSLLAFLGLTHEGALSPGTLCLWAGLASLAYTRAPTALTLALLGLGLLSLAHQRASAAQAALAHASVEVALKAAQEAQAMAQSLVERLAVAEAKLQAHDGALVAIRNRGSPAPGAAQRL